MSLNEVEELVQSLGEARIVRVSPIAGRTFFLRLAVGGEVVELTANVLEILSREKGVFPGTRVPRRRNRVNGNIFEERSHWPVEVLQKLGLPLYWNESWLRAELKRLGSYMEIERVYGYSNTTVSAFAKRNFGLEMKPRKGDKYPLVLQLKQENPDWACEEIARKTGLSKATVWRYLQQAQSSR